MENCRKVIGTAPKNATSGASCISTWKESEMSVPVDWKEVQELNKLPLNQLAKAALRTLKVAPDPTDLYLLQLVRWCVDHGKVKFAGLVQKEVMLEHLEAFHGWSPEIVMQVFQENDLGEPEQIYPAGPVDPVELAEAALEQLHSRLTAAKQGYPVASHRD